MDLIPYLPKEQQEALLAGPALAAPPGIVANFDNPPNRNDIAHATFVICLFFATFSFIIRMYARLVGLRSVKLEDGNTCLLLKCFIIKGGLTANLILGFTFIAYVRPQITTPPSLH